MDLLGHSYGGNIAFGAALLTENIRKLVLYEGWPVPNIAHRTFAPDRLDRIETLLAHDRPGQALEAFYRDVVLMSEEEIADIKALPTWAARVAAAHTVPREIRAFGEQAFDPRWAAKIATPVLLLVGSETPPEIKADPEVVAAALPNATIRVLDGQLHMAHLTDPAGFAEQILEFVRD